MHNDNCLADFIGVEPNQELYNLTGKAMEQNQHHSLSELLGNFSEELGGEDTTVKALIETIGDRGFGLLLLILAFPAALPLPAPGYATPFGIMMVFIGTQIFLGKKSLWLPEKMLNRTLSHNMLSFSIKNGRLPLRAVELIIRPRLTGLARNQTMIRLLGIIVTLMACCMTLPIPLTNTAPSFVIFILAAGMIEEDGLSLLGGVLLAPVAVAIAGAAVYFAVTYGPEAVESTLKPLIKGVIKGESP
jgi:hypothetical protein